MAGPLERVVLSLDTDQSRASVCACSCKSSHIVHGWCSGSPAVTGPPSLNNSRGGHAGSVERGGCRLNIWGQSAAPRPPAPRGAVVHGGRRGPAEPRGNREGAAPRALGASSSARPPPLHPARLNVQEPRKLDE